VRVLYDTSTLFAALIPTHPQYTACFAQLQTAQSGQNAGYLSTHSLAELYSVITRYPVQPRITPTEAHHLIADTLQYLEVVPLTLNHYQAAIAQMVALQIPGGGIFDALIAQAAIGAQVEALLTLNPKHFTRLGEAIARLVQVPT
jgi:predicted nucleic acid-binding protein